MVHLLPYATSDREGNVVGVVARFQQRSINTTTEIGEALSTAIDSEPKVIDQSPSIPKRGYHLSAEIADGVVFRGGRAGGPSVS